MIIAIDFDGTCVTHDYPEVGKNIGAVKVLKQLIEKNHQLILWTMRSESSLDDAVNWFKENNIPLYGIQRNPDQDSWTTSPKAYAQLYIDDAALGIPLMYPINKHEKPYVDWCFVELILKTKGLL
mgnify:CR=1 FL=1